MSRAQRQLSPPVDAGRRRIARIATRTGVAILTTGILLMASGAAGAQTAPVPSNGWEFLMSSGALVPTGSQRTTLKDAPLSTAQASWVAHHRFALTTTLGWARSRDLAVIEGQKLDVFMLDVGAEARTSRRPVGRRGSLALFVGAGAGLRSYNYRRLDVDATHNLAAFGAAGGDLGIRRVHLHLEVRDYVTGFRPLTGEGAAATRNDVAALLGLRLARKE